MSNPIFSRILYQSRLSPLSVAVSTARRRVTYAEFVGEIELVASYLHQHNLPRDALVAVWVADFYLHWIVVLALIKLGRNSVSISSAPHAELAARVVLTDQDTYLAGDVLCIKLSETALTSCESIARFPEPEIQARQPVRVIQSSGTTGHPKKSSLITRCCKRVYATLPIPMTSAVRHAIWTQFRSPLFVASICHLRPGVWAVRWSCAPSRMISTQPCCTTR